VSATHRVGNRFVRSLTEAASTGHLDWY